MSQPASSRNSTSAFFHRRQVLRLAGFGLGGWLLTAGSRATAAGPSRSGGRGTANQLVEIPEEWLQREGSAVRDYAAFLSSLRLRTMSVGQIIAAHGKKRGTVWNSLPPRNAWPLIVPTLKAVDMVGVQLRMPVGDVVSVYRSPAYNSRCEGARSGSWHTRNVAIDVKFAARPSVVAATARALRARGYFRGGVGRYGTFVHIDTRGENFDW